MGRRVKPAKGKAEAKRPTARKVPNDESARVRDLEQRLEEALKGKADALKREAEGLKREAEAQERQTATSEILRVISSSPSDLQPVFDTIVRNAANVCGAFDATLALAAGDDFVTPAHHGPIPRPPIGGVSMRGTVTGRAIREARTVHVADLLATEDFPVGRDLARASGYRTVLIVPLLREGAAIGAIAIRRTEVRPFTDTEMALLQTFADQAVIAIENVRLFKELQQKNEALTQAHARVTEALDQQTATSEILRVISRSPTDVQPVFEAIVQSALRLLAGVGANVARVVGDELHLAAFTATGEAGDSAISATYPMPIDGWNVAARAVRARAPIYLIDTETDPDYQTLGKAVTQARGVRSIVAVPMISQGSVVGTIAVSRREPGSFSAKEIALLQTFADQAVIAIENVRLFKELQTSNRELTTALDTQTATSDILRVISRSQTDVQPVFDAIVISARRLLRGDFGVLTRVIGDRIDNVANIFAGGAEHPAVRFTWPLDGDNGHAEAIRQRGPVNIADAQTH